MILNNMPNKIRLKKITKNTKILWLISILSIIFSLAIGLDISPFLRGPAPYFPDWRWTYQFTNTLTKLWFPLVVFAGILFYTNNLEKKSEQNLRKHEKKYLLLLLILSFLFQISVIYYSRAGLGVFLHRIITPGISGYFSTSLPIKNISVFLSLYQQNVGSYPMYARFHPPGSILIFYFFEQIIRLFPSIDFVTYITIRHTDVNTIWNSLLPYQKIAGLSSGFLISFLSGLTIIPLYYLSKLIYSTKTAIRAGILFILIPSVTLFLPLNDCFFPLFSAVSLFFFLKGIKEKNKIDIGISGIILFLGVFFTLTSLSLLFAFFIIYLLSARKKNLKIIYFLPVVLYFSFGFLLLPILFYFIYHFNSITVMQTLLAYHNHVQSSRNNPLWLIYNYYDFFVFIGLPLAVLFFIMLKDELQKIYFRQKIDTLFISFCLMTIIIDIMGTTNAEVGRIWLPFFPLILLPLVNFLTNRLKFTRSDYLIFLLLQGIQVIILQTFWVTVW